MTIIADFPSTVHSGIRMDMATSTLMAKMAELQMNRADADVTFNCDGKVIKAHSFILGMR